MGDEESGRELIAPLLELEPEMSTMATMPAAGLVRLHNDPEGNTPAIGDGAHHREPPGRGHRGPRRGRRSRLRLALHLGRAPPARRRPRPPGSLRRRRLPPRGRLRALLGRAAVHARAGAGAGAAPRRGRRGHRALARRAELLQLRRARGRQRDLLPGHQPRPPARDPRALRPVPSCSAPTSASSPPASTGRSASNTPPVRRAPAASLLLPRGEMRRAGLQWPMPAPCASECSCPRSSATCAGPSTVAMARAAEEVGFDSIWLGDHLLYRDEAGRSAGRGMRGR